METTTPSQTQKQPESTFNNPENKQGAEPNLRDLYDLANVEAFRSEADKVYNDALASAIEQGGNNLTALLAARHARIDSIGDLLNGYGIDDTNPNHEQIFRDFSDIVEIPQSEWYASDNGIGTEDRPEVGISGRDLVRTLYLELSGEPYYASNDEKSLTADEETTEITPDNPENDDPAVEAARLYLDTLRTKMAKLSAKRQSRLFTLVGGKNGQGYEAIKEEYNQQIRALASLELSDTLSSETLTYDEKNKAVIELIFKEQAKLREEAKQTIADSRVQKVIKWMNEGSRAQRAVKGIAVGLGTAAAAGLVATAAGAVGAGAVVGAAAFAVGSGVSRLARTYARIEGGNSGMADLDDSHKQAVVDYMESNAEQERETASLLGLEEIEQTNGDVKIDDIQEYFDRQLEQDTKLEQKKHRRAAVIGLGVVGLGAVAGGLAANAVSESGLLDGLFGGTDVGAAPQPEAPAEPVIDPEIKDILDTDTSADLPIDSVDGGQAGEVLPPAPEVTYDTNFYVESGQGGISLFQQMGLSEYDWYSIHQELADNFPQDFYSEGGDTRLMHEGQLSLEAQEFIKARFGL